jgi:hypothetical protein
MRRDPALVTSPGTRERGAFNPLSSRSFPLWFAVVGAPLAWGVTLVLGDLISELGCSSGVRGHRLFGLSLQAADVIQSVVAAGIVVLATFLAMGAWRRLRRAPDGTSWGRAHTMALWGMASSLIYFVLIVYGLITHLFLDSCLPPL